MYPCTNGDSGLKVCITMPTVLASQIARNSDPFLHGDPARKIDTPVAPGGVFCEESGCLDKEDLYPLVCKRTPITLLAPPAHHRSRGALAPFPDSDMMTLLPSTLSFFSNQSFITSGNA